MSRLPLDNARNKGLFLPRCLLPSFLLFVVTVLCIGRIQAGSTGADDPAPGSPPDSGNSTIARLPSHPPPDDCYQEICGFTIEGKRLTEKTQIFDFEVMATPEGKRFLPLLRLLEMLKVEFSQQDQHLVITLPNSGKARLNLLEKKFTLNEAVHETPFYTATSDISLEKDVFLPPEAIKEILRLKMAWNDSEYAYQASTRLSYPVWERGEFSSLLGITTSEMKEDLPESHPAAYPARRAFSLDFMKLRGRAKLEAIEGPQSDKLVVDSLEQSFWGGLAGGRFKLTLSEQSFQWDEEGFQSSRNPEIFPNWAEWRYLNDSGNKEVVIGDSVFGLNNLTYPTLRLTGIRTGGHIGGSQDEYSARINPGLSTTFSKPLVFEGRALVGSRAELFINDVLVDSDEVISSLPEDPGVGKYLFDNVQLPPGSVNEVRIEITDPNEVVQIIERRIIGTANLLPEGELSYIGGLGTQREFNDYAAQGFLAGGRMLYGINSRLTIGGTAAYQDGYFDQDTIVLSGIDERTFPQQSWHLGFQSAWQPLSYSIFSGDFSFSSMEMVGGEEVRDPAFRFNWLLAPLDDLDLYALYLWYGPDFFNGSSRKLRDREGYAFDLEWRPHRLFNLKLSGGDVWNNLDSEVDETLSVNYQSVKINSRLPFYTSLSAGYDRLTANWEDSVNLVTLGLRSYLPGSIVLDAGYATGDDLRLEENYDFLQGLRLPGLSLFATRSTSFSLRRRLPGDWGNMALNYWETGERERISLIHSTNYLFDQAVQMRTEAGFDIDKDSPFFENRTEVPLTESKETRLGLQARLEDEEWKVSLYLSLSELFSFNKAGPSLVGKRLNPEKGVLKGRVFLDKNANTVLDPDESGLQGIDILLDRRLSATSKYNGNFLIPRPGNKKKVRLTLDMDSIPAIYTPTHASQQVFLRENEVTRVFFGITPVHAVSGYVVSQGEGGKPKAQPGIRVFIIAAEKGGVTKANNNSGPDAHWISESITADDGSFYLENIKPGEYRIGLDPGTIPSSLAPREKYVEVEIKPSEYPEEIQTGNIELLSAPGEPEEGENSRDYATNAAY